MVELRNLSAGYGTRQVISGIDLEFPAGKVTVLAGPNGCGKSTLLKSVAGMLDCEGQILLNGEALQSLPPRQRARRVACLPQNRQVPEISVRRLVLHGRFPYLSYPRRYRPEDLAAAETAMTAMGMEDLAERSLTSLSGGQRQKVYIAMLLAQDTPVVLMDEPTTFLDIGHQLQLMGLARQLADRGKTVVLVLHDLPLALAHGDRLVLMKDGHVVMQGAPEDIFQSDAIRQVFGAALGRTRVGDAWKYFYL